MILNEKLPQNAELIFIYGFTKAAQTAYALSNLVHLCGAEIRFEERAEIPICF